MRKFIALSLSFFILTNIISNFAFADPVKATTSSNLIRTKVIKLDPGLISDDNEDIYAIRLIQVEAISPENLPLRSVIVIRLENRALNWDRWDLFRSIVSATIGSAIGAIFRHWNAGLLAGLAVYNACKYIKYWIKNKIVNKLAINFSGTSVEVVLILLSNEEAKTLTGNYVYVGEMKQPLIDYNNQINAINAENGISDADDFKIKIWQKAKNGLYDPNVDRHDPYNLVGTTRIFNINPDVSSRNPNDFYNKKEADEINAKIDQAMNKVLTKLKNMVLSKKREVVDDSNSNDSSWILTKKNPKLSLLVAVINHEEKLDAFTLSAIRNCLYPNLVTMGSSEFNFGAELVFNVDAPKKRQYEEIRAKLGYAPLNYWWKKIKDFFWKKEESDKEESAEEVHFAQNSERPLDPEWVIPPKEDQETQADFGINEGVQVNPRTAPRYRDAEADAPRNQNAETNATQDQNNLQPQNFDDPNDELYALGLKNPF